jgi:hypothetical protein
MIPAVEGLLPEPHNTKLLILLYSLAEWHAFAKLRMHTEHTLGAMEKATSAIGHGLRSFRDWSHSTFIVKELPSETTARGRRTRKKLLKSTGSKVQLLPAPPPSARPARPSPKVKKLNLFTYKLHALGDYVRTIRLFGTTDSYSTQIVCYLSQRWNYSDVLFRENLLIVTSNAFIAGLIR